MGKELSEKIGITTIARSGGKHFLVYNGSETVVLDEKPIITLLLKISL